MFIAKQHYSPPLACFYRYRKLHKFVNRKQKHIHAILLRLASKKLLFTFLMKFITFSITENGNKMVYGQADESVQLIILNYSLISRLIFYWGFPFEIEIKILILNSL